MGSLMGGWGSHATDPKSVKFTRNKSLTKDEIDAFWKSKKLKEEEHLKDMSLLSPRTQKVILEEVLKRSEEGGSSDANLEKILQKNGWWISSNLAFLNEPPVITQEGGRLRYASHVTHVMPRADGSSTAN